jgi:hypothetical protein
MRTPEAIRVPPLTTSATAPNKASKIGVEAKASGRIDIMAYLP